MKTNISSSSLFAAAALAGILTGGMTATVNAANMPAKGELAGVRSDGPKGETHSCAGKNSCKGKGGCKTGDNSCAGKNSCKGKGGCATKDGKPEHAK